MNSKPACDAVYGIPGEGALFTANELVIVAFKDSSPQKV